MGLRGRGKGRDERGMLDESKEEKEEREGKKEREEERPKSS